MRGLAKDAEPRRRVLICSPCSSLSLRKCVTLAYTSAHDHQCSATVITHLQGWIHLCLRSSLWYAPIPQPFNISRRSDKPEYFVVAQSRIPWPSRLVRVFSSSGRYCIARQRRAGQSCLSGVCQIFGQGQRSRFDRWFGWGIWR